MHVDTSDVELPEIAVSGTAWQRGAEASFFQVLVSC